MPNDLDNKQRPVYHAIVNGTEEKITVYKLRSGNWACYSDLAVLQQPYISIKDLPAVNQRDFAPEAITLGEEIPREKL